MVEFFLETSKVFKTFEVWKRLQQSLAAGNT